MYHYHRLYLKKGTYRKKNYILGVDKITFSPHDVYILQKWNVSKQNKCWKKCFNQHQWSFYTYLFTLILFHCITERKKKDMELKRVWFISIAKQSQIFYNIMMVVRINFLIIVSRRKSHYSRSLAPISEIIIIIKTIKFDFEVVYLEEAISVWKALCPENELPINNSIQKKTGIYLLLN